MFFMTPSLVDAQTVVLTPSNLPNWSGTVTSAGVVSSSAIANIENGANKGFVRFDLSSLPTGAVISSASLRLKTVNGLGATSGNAEITTTVSTVNTLTATSAAIAAAINSSTASNAGVTSWVSISSSVTLNLSFSNYSKTQLQDAIAGGFVTIGIVNNSNLIHNFYDSSTGSADIPQLTITYNVPIAPPNCSPSPLLPLVGDTMIIRNNTRLVWNAAFGYPSSYDVYFDANPSPTTLVYSNQSFSQYIHSTVLASKTTYYWKVVPRNFKGPATGCAVWNFTTGSSLLYCVTSPLIGGSGDIITNVTMGTLNNTSTYSTVSPSYFTSYNNSPPPNLTQGISQNISITFGANGTQHSAVWIDFNQNGTYEPSENVALSTVALGANATITYSLNIPPTAKLGLTKMRVRGGSNTAYTAEGACTQSSYGETEDYDVNITPGVTCTGVPSAGTTTSTSTTACNNVNFSLGLSGASMTTGLTYQWESSPTGAGTFSSVSGATSPIFLATQSAATDYRCVITCIVSGSSATSVPVTVNMSNLFNCYCTNTALSNGNEEITKVTFNNVSNTSTCASLTGTIGTATGTANLYANYTNYNLTNILQGSTIPYSVEITQCTGSSFGHAANIYIDFNRNGALTDAGEVFSIWTYASSGTHTVSGNIVVPIGASVGATLMRVEVKENNSLGSCASGQVTKGETEDYKINILPNTACNGMPISGVTISSSTNACSGVNFNLSLSGASLEIGLTY